MNSIQLNLLPEDWSPLDETIQKIRELGSRHNNYVRFVRRVAASAMGQRPGSVILCAALSDFDAVEICGDIRLYIEESLKKYSNPSAGVCMVDTPHALRAREMRGALVEAYHQAGDLFCASHRSGPRFQLEGAPAYFGQNHAQRIATLIAHRDPAFYIFKNVHLLQRIDSQPSDALEFVRMFAQIADTSGRTHILLGDAHTVLGWMKTTEIANSVTPLVLEPYDFNDDDDKAYFLSMLAGYDLDLPWQSGVKLADHGEYVHRIVGGSPHRVRKWVLNALCRARALAQAELTWDCFTASQPSKSEVIQAGSELTLVREFVGRPVKLPAPPSDQPKHNQSPGTRNLGRDPYAESA